jgi:hypothetical protein
MFLANEVAVGSADVKETLETSGKLAKENRF